MRQQLQELGYLLSLSRVKPKWKFFALRFGQIIEVFLASQLDPFTRNDFTADHPACVFLRSLYKRIRFLYGHLEIGEGVPFWGLLLSAYFRAVGWRHTELAEQRLKPNKFGSREIDSIRSELSEQIGSQLKR